MKLSRTSSLLLFACIAVTACASTVSGHTFQDNGGVVKIEFKSGGKAYVSAGPTSHTCSYTEKDKKVNLVCDGDTTTFTVEDDGSLTGPPDGLMARLTLVKP